MDCCWEHGQHIRITIGPSQSYDPSEPLCLPEIAELQRVAGLQDYTCTGNLHSGKYVKIHKTYVQGQNEFGLVLCEVKIFTIPLTATTPSAAITATPSAAITTTPALPTCLLDTRMPTTAVGTSQPQPDLQSCQSFCRTNHPSAPFFQYANFSTDASYHQKCWCRSSDDSQVASSGTISGMVNCIVPATASSGSATATTKTTRTTTALATLGGRCTSTGVNDWICNGR